MCRRKFIRKKRFAITLIVNSISILIFIYLTVGARQVLIDIRQSLFTEITDNPEVFEITKMTAAKKYSFLIENKSVIRDYSQRVKENVNYIKPEVIDKLQTMDTAKKAQFITLLYSKNGGPGCGNYKDLMHNILRLDDNNGMGCCSDHAEVFIALSHIFGLNSREVHHTNHTFNEVYDPDINKWLWIDTQFAIMAKDDKNNYLSLLEMTRYVNKGKQISYDFFGNASHTFSRLLPIEHEYYDSKDDFEYIELTLGDNVFSQDHFNKKIIFLPKPIRQIIALVQGIQPKYITYTPKMTKTLKRFHYIKIIVIILVLTLSVINILALLAFLASFISMIKKYLKRHFHFTYY